jgi:ubiquinone/menaquinone biosynthesis methyltransferase
MLQRRFLKLRSCMGNLRYTSTTNVKTDFGFKDVDKEAKENMVREVFDKVADRYDLMNDVMSAGVHRLWKDELVSMIGLRAAAKVNPEWIPRHLDVAGGTGDVAFRVLKEMDANYPNLFSTGSSLSSSSSKANEATNLESESESESDIKKTVVICDINTEMLKVGRQRAESQLGPILSSHVGFVEGNAEHLTQFQDNSFDTYTIAFGLRNVTNKDAALKEAYRVLRPGGRLIVMEFSKLSNPMLQKAYDVYSHEVIPRLGEAVAGDSESYRYLVESIRRFPDQDTLLGMLRDAGFKAASYTNFTFGVVAVHSGYKI